LDRFDLFPSPVFVFLLGGELDAEATALLVAESTTTPGIQRSNHGDWHSIPNFAQRPEPCFRAIADRIVQHVRGVIITLAGATPPPRFGVSAHGWAMVMNDGDYATVHDHAEAHWSAVYYLDAGETDPERSESGVLALVDPRRASVRTPGFDLGSTFTIRPKTGMLVIFPGSLQHFVHPYRGARPRVSVSFNLVARPEP
jgi:uncharacterized protein (TIGR02466 family)